VNNATVSPIPKEMADAIKAKGVWREGCPVPMESLSLITVSYFDFEGTEHPDGEIVVHSSVAPQVGSVFDALHARRFPIAKMRPLHHYGGDDEASMADNNTSCFNYREMIGTGSLSMHAYGLAVDLNPLQNPYVVFEKDNEGRPTIYPRAGWEFLNRHNQKTGMVEQVVELFADRGFVVWGGKWTTPIDYHHFQVPRGMTLLLPILSSEDGHTLMTLASEMAAQLRLMPADEEWIQPLIEIYRNDKSNFFDAFLQKLKALTAS
jgi:hypothetical protein